MSDQNNATSRWLFYVPNDESGREFIDTLKSVMNKDRYSLKVRGRRPDHDKAVELGYQDHYRYRRFEYSVPIEVAKLLSVYVEDRHEERRSHELWEKNYQLQKELESLKGGMYDATVDDLTDQVKTLRQSNHTMSTINADLAEQLALHKECNANQRESIVKYQERDDPINPIFDGYTREKLLKAQVQQYEIEVRNLHDSLRAKTDYAQELMHERDRLRDERDKLQGYTNQNLLEDLTVIISRALDSLDKGDNDKLKENGKTIVTLQNRIEELELLIGQTETNFAGELSLLQNNMRDKDIPLLDE